jgi:hypothetical protein
MSTHALFRRQPVPQQLAPPLQTVTLPAPIRGIIESENEAFMQPGGAIVQDNWIPTMRGCRLRGGTKTHCTLPDVNPVVSAFEYVNGANVHQMFASQHDKLYNVTSTSPVLVASVADGNWSTAQLSNLSGEHLLALNDAGDYAWYYDGTAWTHFDAGQITGPAGSGVDNGAGLTYVWKYRSRLFFIQGGTMNAYYLNVDEYQGTLQQIPLGGAGTKGGALIFGATWSVDTGAGPDDRCVFYTTEGEALLFTGNNPGDPTNWAQLGVYAVGRPMGKNAHLPMGGDLLIATIDGIVPLSKAIQVDAGSLDLAMLTRPIRQMWRQEVALKGGRPWTMRRWDVQGIMFVTWPGGLVGQRTCGVLNNATGAWGRMTYGYDALCFVGNGDNLYFGTQDGTIVQCELGGSDDGALYVASLVGGWEMFGAPSNTNIWLQARAVFASTAAQPFVPQLSACIDYQIELPLPPPPGPDPGIQEVWDSGDWDVALWDQITTAVPPIRNTRWVSVGRTGFAHAPTVQVSVQQQALPQVELLGIAATYQRVGVNV